MLKIFLLTLLVLSTIFPFAQPPANADTSWKRNYRESASKINDLVNTKLDVKFDYQKAYLYGKAWITLKPHFYPTDSLMLDAKGMNINKVAIVKNGKNKELTYSYDSLNLHVGLDKIYKRSELYTVYIDYTSKPNEFKALGSAAITDAKGLYFINPTGADKTKPIQIWTQGETEANSVWFPTIDKPNQKTTEEISMTVPSKYVTLSNGLLVSQKTNNDGTRTDTWKMDLPHCPYLFFMGVGDYAIIKDKYKEKEVAYFVEKDYAAVARQIFGYTPEMIKFFSSALGVDFPWPKYDQIVGREYVSGAMENTTATLHQERAQQNARQLMDGNRWESVIAHELFHQWFGDYVTAESWSNITVNESMATLGSELWNEYKHGKDAGDEEIYNSVKGYLNGNNEKKNLVRYYYNDKEDVFDAVSYNKGGGIQQMLRKYLGDSAFFRSLNLYLTTNKFKSAEAAQMRLAFEEVSGQDLHWFWNQWYYGSGHPKLDITYDYNVNTKTEQVYVKQTQPDKVFKLPVAIDVYNGTNKTRYNVWVNNREDTFSFAVNARPDLVNFDADKILICEKNDKKSLEEYVFQYNYAKKFVDRKEAIDYCVEHFDQPAAKALLSQALSDPFYKLRQYVVASYAAKKPDEAVMRKIANIATNDPDRPTRSVAIGVLSANKGSEYKSIFTSGVTDSSYSVAAASLIALSEVDEPATLSILPALKKDAKAELSAAIEEVEVLNKKDGDFASISAQLDSLQGFSKFQKIKMYTTFLRNVEVTENFEKGVDRVIALRNKIAPVSAAAKDYLNKLLQDVKAKKLAKKNTNNSSIIDEQVKYLDEKIRS